MEKKQTLTNNEIKKDIINALKNPPEESKSSYKIQMVATAIIFILFIVIECIYHAFIFWAFGALVICLIANCVINNMRLKNLERSVNVNDYEISRETVHSVSEETYKADAGGTLNRRRTEIRNNYTVIFESGKIWRIPAKENYAWNERLRTQALGIYRSTHKGDTMIAVTKKDTGKTVMAYNSDLFEYK